MILQTNYNLIKECDCVKKIIALFLSLVCMLGLAGCKWMFDAQYNENGVGHFLVITIDESQPKEYIGELDTHKIFAEKLNMDATYFISLTAENIPIKEAIEDNLVSINDWRKYAWKIEKAGDAEILQYENYEIVITRDECVIRPRTK